ncbi:ribosomal protein L24E [Ophiocordyceps sinensis CO18]|uniref:Ribosomal protein L24E n=1 Tax=Ophiocordyceps sinensis (strain Co18 / CGMCC 3.14243) TaxID=911162 RepID=T5AC94_OPHSC|nr:ribosomal protein L24E [Ophiocordyceps sinensis CO18]
MQHHPHHQQQGLPPSQHLHHSRPPSIVHQHQHPHPHPHQHQHHHTQGHAQGHAQQHPHSQPAQAHHHQSAYSSTHSLPQAYQAAANQGANTQDNLGYYNHPSPYSTPGANSGYTSADTSDMMAAAQMPRPPYPPMSYHTPQSNSPSSVASPSQHDQHRSIYGQPPSQHLQQSMYYQPQPHYQSMQPHPSASPYAQHAHHPQPAMTSQPNMMMSHAAPQNQMTHHAAQQHAQQSGMTGSPRPKIEPQVPVQLQKQAQASPIQQAQHQLQQTQHQQTAPPLQSPGNQAAGINPNAAPGPIPATTPLVVRQDGNGVQWIAFEYSRDRVKMEYTIRCDVESVTTEELSPEFKQENCVYPRACCAKDQYRGNRLMYETDCNRVGWALAQLTPPLRGKRGLIQRAVDSWRNSNQDPRLRSRRVRRMAKMNNRKHVQGTPTPHPGAAHMPGPGGPMGPGGVPAMGKPGMGSMGQPMHHHAGGHADGGAPGGGDEVGTGNSYEEQHHHQAPTAPGHVGDDVRQAHVFAGYGGQGYPTGAQGGSMSHMAPRAGGAIPARSHGRSHCHEPDGLFPDIPEAKKRKFILVEDNVRGSRLRVRVTLDGVDTNEIPDSFRKGASVYPRSYFPREMQSPPPSATGSRFFTDDVSDDGIEETEGRDTSHHRAPKAVGEVVKVAMAEGHDGEATIPRTRNSRRGKEVRLNDLAYRMAWLQSRVFAGRTVFLQRALDCYRNKTRAAIEGTMQDVTAVAPYYETRAGKRKWNDRRKRDEESDD